MAVSSVEAGENECVLSELEEMVDHFEKFNTFVSIDHTSLLINQLYYEESYVGRSSDESLCQEYLKLLDGNKCFDPIRRELRFIAVRTRLEQNA